MKQLLELIWNGPWWASICAIVVLGLTAFIVMIFIKVIYSAMRDGK